MQTENLTDVPAPTEGAIPSEDQLADEIRKYAPAMFLYQPSDEWLTFEHGGRIYDMPPDLGGKLVPHPRRRDPKTLQPEMAKADGRLGVKDVYGMHRDQRGQALGMGPFKGMESSSIVRFACGYYYERGVVWLRGDASDEGRKAAAKRIYGVWVRHWAEQQKAARDEFVNNFRRIEANKERRVPRPTAQQRRAQDILDMLSEGERAGTEYVCPMGCSEWSEDDYDKYERHMRVQHQKKVEPRKRKDETEEGAPRTLETKAPTAAEADAAARAAAAAPSPAKGGGKKQK